MKLLKRYCSTVCCINGLDTYIISPIQYDCLITDKELLKKLNIPQAGDLLLNFIQTARKINDDKLYFSFVHHKNRKKAEWEPLLCYKNEDTFYHVAYRDSWICRECGHTLYASILMPMSEADAVFKNGTGNQYPDIPPFFQKIPCPKCRRPLQNHLFILKTPYPHTV